MAQPTKMVTSPREPIVAGPRRHPKHEGKRPYSTSMTSGDAIKLTTNGQKTAARSAPAALRARVLEGLLARLRRVAGLQLCPAMAHGAADSVGNGTARGVSCGCMAARRAARDERGGGCRPAGCERGPRGCPRPPARLAGSGQEGRRRDLGAHRAATA
jgi:hypothetical protein